MRVNFKELHRQYELLGERPAEALLQEALADGAIDPRSFSFREMFGEFFGWDALRQGDPGRDSLVQLMEHAGATTTAAFQSISSQVIFAMIMADYQAPEFIFSRLIPVRQTKIDMEKIAGIAPIADHVQTVGETELYPLVSVGPTWRHGPLLKKRGFRIALTKEAIWFDRTGRLQEEARNGALPFAQNREKRAVDTVIDENAGAISAVMGGHRYHFKDNSIATYGNSSGNHNWDNLAGTNALVDWTDLDAAGQLLDEMTHPDTGEPIVFQAKHLVCTRGLALTAGRTRNATEITVTVPGFATSANPTQYTVTNPFGNQFEVLSSPYVASRLATDTDWFYGDVTRAFEYVQTWPEEMKTLGSNSQDEFERDIVVQYRWSEYGNYSTKEPRYMVKSTVA